MKLGILGVAHLHIYSYLPILLDQKIGISGVYDWDENRAIDFAKQFSLVNYLSIDQLLETDCDTVLICSENIFHKELALQAMKKQKNVIVEKPMALTSNDAEEMIDEAKKQQVKLMIAHPVRFSQVAQDAKKVIQEQHLGELLAINASNHGKNPGGWFVDPELSGGGALIDHTVHICDLVYDYFELIPCGVTAFKGQKNQNLQVEDIGLVKVDFEGGVFLSLDTSWNRPDIYPVWGDAVMELVFEKGRLGLDGFGRKLKIYSDLEGVIEEFYYEEDMDIAMIKAFIQAVDEDLASPVPGEAGLYTVKITEQAFQSANQRERSYQNEKGDERMVITE